MKKEMKTYKDPLGRGEGAGRYTYAMLSVAGVLSLFLLWQVAVSMGWISEKYLARPTEILLLFFDKFSNPAPDGTTIIPSVLSSLQIALTGLGFGVAVGIPVGLLMGWYKGFDKFINPLFEILRPIPPISWIPLITIWFGIGEFPKILIVFIGAVMPVVINTHAGLKNVEQLYLDVGTVFNANKRQMLFEIAIPSAFGSIFAGIRTSTSTAWMVVLAAEMLGAKSGVGFLVVRGMEGDDMALVLVAMVTIGVVGALLSIVTGFVERRLCPWERKK